MPRKSRIANVSSLAWLVIFTTCGCATTPKYVAAPPEPRQEPPAALLIRPTPINYKDEFAKALSNWLGLPAAASPSTTNSSP